MAKKSKGIPKKVAGLKIPKSLRKSKLLQSMLNSHVGRTIVADALIAGAGAAASTLIRQREDVADAAKVGGKRGAHSFALASEAISAGADAIMDVVADAAHSLVPDKKPKRKHVREPAEGHVRERTEETVRH